MCFCKLYLDSESEMVRWQARARSDQPREALSHKRIVIFFSRILEGLLFGGHLSNLVSRFLFYSFAEVRERRRRVEVDRENKVDISLQRTLRAHLGSVFMEVRDPKGPG